MVKKLPKDKELIDAATIFSKRGAVAAAELAVLEKAIAEKTATLKKAGDEVNAAAHVVLAVRAKVLPVRDSVRQKEKIAVEGRRRMAETRSVAEDHQKRLTLLEAFVRYQTLQQQIATTNQTLVALRNSLATAQTVPLNSRSTCSRSRKSPRPLICARSRRRKPGPTLRRRLSCIKRFWEALTPP